MRDFFYSKGDIFIAVLIILVAVFIIYLRVGVIMGYDPFGGGEGSLLQAPPAGTEPATTTTMMEPITLMLILPVAMVSEAMCEPEASQWISQLSLPRQ